MRGGQCGRVTHALLHAVHQGHSELLLARLSLLRHLFLLLPHRRRPGQPVSAEPQELVLSAFQLCTLIGT